jgi:taurine transport system substrate-binding protein
VAGEVFWIYDIIGENEALVVRKNSDINSITDLAGKRVSAPFGATTHYHLLAAFKEFGLDPDNVEIFDMQPPEMLAAWQRGDLDAGFVWEPTLAKMLELDGRVLISSGELAARGYLTGDIGLVRKEFAESYPELITAYLANLDRAVKYYRSNPEEAAQAVARQFGIPTQEAARQMKSLVWLDGEEQLSAAYLGTSDKKGELAKVFEATGQFLFEQGTIREAPGIEVFQNAINPSYLEAAVR